MNKIQVDILGLSASPASNGAYALILKEAGGNRRLPIVIGAFEAQAIVMEMEGIKPARPLTHDLLKSLLDTLGATLTEICISSLHDSTFYARLILDSTSVEVDARPSDAIALALRANAPIFVSEEVLDEAGFTPEGGDDEEGFEEEEAEEDDVFSASAQTPAPEVQPEPAKETPQPVSRLEQLKLQLDSAISKEDYERAAKIRDEIQKLTGNPS